MSEPNDAVAMALQRAAARAQRHAELDSAVTTMGRLLNFPLAPEMLPWGPAMFFGMNSEIQLRMTWIVVVIKHYHM